MTMSRACVRLLIRALGAACTGCELSKRQLERTLGFDALTVAMLQRVTLLLEIKAEVGWGMVNLRVWSKRSKKSSQRGLLTMIAGP